jgi:anthranilate/para-aminobenzoate synthase component II
MARKRRIWSVFYRDEAFNALGPGWTTIPVSHVVDFRPEPGDLTLILGGGDISPQVYGHGYVDRVGRAHARASHGHIPPRDELELEVMLRSIDKGIPIVGCCRGGQMICIGAGGSLVQDVTNHLGMHELILNDGRKLFCNSIHHQMMRYKSTNHVLLGWSPHRSDHYHAFHDYDPKIECPEGEPEIVFFPTIKGLAFQYHPESNINSDYGQVAIELTRKYLLEETA